MNHGRRKQVSEENGGWEERVSPDGRGSLRIEHLGLCLLLKAYTMGGVDIPVSEEFGRSK